MITVKITISCMNINIWLTFRTVYLYKHPDSGNVVFSLFLDFRKAFDCVNHEIQLSKLITY